MSAMASQSSRSSFSTSASAAVFPAKQRPTAHTKQRTRTAGARAADDARHSGIVSSVQNGRQVFASFVDNDSSESSDQDFVGFGATTDDTPSATDDRSDERVDDHSDERVDDHLKQSIAEYADAMARGISPNERMDATLVGVKLTLKQQWEERLRRVSATATPSPPSRPSTQIVREARFQYRPQTDDRPPPLSPALASPTPALTPAATAAPTRRRAQASANSSGQPGFITCAICHAQKYYAHVQRRFGVFSCEPCSKFFSRFLRAPNASRALVCAADGTCRIDSRVADDRSARCRHCWLKLCLQAFPRVDPHLRLLLAAGIRAPHTPLTVDTTPSAGGATDAQHKSGLLMLASDRPALVHAHKPFCGPRVKRVCRRSAPDVANRPARAVVESTADALIGCVGCGSKDGACL